MDHLHRSTPVGVPTIEVGHLLQALRRNSWTAAAGLAAPRRARWAFLRSAGVGADWESQPSGS